MPSPRYEHLYGPLPKKPALKSPAFYHAWGIDPKDDMLRDQQDKEQETRKNMLATIAKMNQRLQAKNDSIGASQDSSGIKQQPQPGSEEELSGILSNVGATQPQPAQQPAKPKKPSISDIIRETPEYNEYSLHPEMQDFITREKERESREGIISTLEKYKDNPPAQMIYDYIINGGTDDKIISAFTSALNKYNLQNQTGVQKIEQIKEAGAQKSGQISQAGEFKLKTIQLKNDADFKKLDKITQIKAAQDELDFQRKKELQEDKFADSDVKQIRLLDFQEDQKALDRDLKKYLSELNIEAKKELDAIRFQNKKLRDIDLVKIGANSIKDDLNLLKEEHDKLWTGYLEGRIQSLDVYSPEVAGYNALRNKLLKSIARTYEGARISNMDMTFYDKMVPTIYNSKEQFDAIIKNVYGYVINDVAKQAKNLSVQDIEDLTKEFNEGKFKPTINKSSYNKTPRSLTVGGFTITEE